MRTTAHESPEHLEDELASLAAHINAATARWIELVWAFCEHGGPADGDVARWLAFRCGIATREAREVVRVAEALRELPAIRRAFAGGTLPFTKVRALTRVATATSEEGLLELASALTAPQLERALRAFRRLRSEDAGDSLEYCDYHWGDDGSLFLRARLPAEDGTLLVRALEAARERVRERRRGEDETETSGDRDPRAEDAARSFEPPRSVLVEALVEVAQASLSSSGDRSPGLAQLVVHVDALALAAGGDGRSELEDGPVVSPETALRLGCDAEILASVERHGLPVSSGRRRRTVPPAMRRLLEARDDRTCRWPGCENRRRLQAHHRRHWAHGGETSLDNLVLLCCTTTASCTRAGTGSRTSRPVSCASATATGFSARARLARRPGTSMTSSRRTSAWVSRSTRGRTGTATATRSTSSSRLPHSSALRASTMRVGPPERDLAVCKRWAMQLDSSIPSV